MISCGTYKATAKVCQDAVGLGTTCTRVLNSHRDKNIHDWSIGGFGQVGRGKGVRAGGIPH